MESVKINRQTDIDRLALGLLDRTVSLEVALAAWRRERNLKLTDVSQLIKRGAGAVSAMLHDPQRCPGVRLEVAALIGYEERVDRSQ